MDKLRRTFAQAIHSDAQPIENSDAILDFARSELTRVTVTDSDLESMCRDQASSYLPRQDTGAGEVAAFICNLLRQRRPGSLVRVGDGEGMALRLAEGSSNRIHLDVFQRKVRKQNGQPIPDDAAHAFAKAVRDAIDDADVIGFRSLDSSVVGSEMPRIRHYLDARKRPSWFLKKVDGSLGILYAREHFAQQLAQRAMVGKVVTSAWIHLGLIRHLDAILSAAESVIIITGRPSLENPFRERLGAKLRRFITVPVQGYHAESLEASHYGIAPQIMRELASLSDMPGTVVLIGAGLFGKLYAHHVKAHGAVAVDLGSAFDLLSGVSTRPAHRSIDMEAVRWI
jgi:hypothetical protein